MPAMAPPVRPMGTTDDFDMAKLQKSLRQRQRHSLRQSPHVVKLTPAEIRSLNNEALSSKTGSQSSKKSGDSASRSRRSTNNTPPATPDHHHRSAPHRSTSRNSAVGIPTPPHTPSNHRKSSQSSNHGHGSSHQHQGVASGVIHHPRPRVSAKVAFMNANGSRPSSSGSSTYRGYSLPTYRGAEVGRTNSMNLLARPSASIVANPLSQFSRPRQSAMNSTYPERCRQDSSDHHGPHMLNSRSNSLPNISAPSSRQPSPTRITESPVSNMDDTEKFPILLPADDPHNQPKDLSADEEDVSTTGQPTAEEKQQTSESLVTSQPEPAVETSTKKDVKQKRFTMSGALFGDKHKGDDGHKLKKARRRTLSFTKSRDAEPTQHEGDRKVPLQDEHAVDGANLEANDFSSHPAIRPLSLVIPSESKGKEKEIQSAPVYTRCACCGKMKRPPAYSSELSPVLENENLRTNFSFEIERTSGTPNSRRSSDASRSKFTPIIPMEVGLGQTRQASVEPFIPPPTMVPSIPNSITPTSPKKSRKHLDPPKFVRFASLHGRRDNVAPIIAEEEEMDSGAPVPTDIEIVTVQGENFEAMHVVTREPFIDQDFGSNVPVNSIDETTNPNHDLIALELPANATEEILPPTSNGESEVDKGLKQTGEATQEAGDIEKALLPETGLPRNESFLGLPEPMFEPAFAGDNSILKPFSVSADGTVATGITKDQEPNETGEFEHSNLLEPERQKRQRIFAEIMAVRA